VTNRSVVFLIEGERRMYDLGITELSEKIFMKKKIEHIMTISFFFLVQVAEIKKKFLPLFNFEKAFISDGVIMV
jgi:hypothetical protein